MSRASGTRATIGRILRRNALLVALVLVHAAAAFALGLALGEPFQASVTGLLLLLFRTAFPGFLVLLMFARLAHMWRHVETDRPARWLAADLRRILLDPDRMIGGAIALLAIALFASSFGFIKPLIPQIAPFSWDTTFAALDRALHGGEDPYRPLLALLGAPRLLSALNVVYHLWFLVLFFLVFIACFTTETRSRNTFLVAFVLTWALGGNLLATLFSSAGPVYYDPLGLGRDFVPLMEHLRAADAASTLWALHVQDALWEGYVQGGGGGISAMPSMHVGVAVLLALYGARLARWAGIALSVFAALIMLGSVVLGWHYAIDGYAGAAVAFGAWALARRLVEAGPELETAGVRTPA